METLLDDTLGALAAHLRRLRLDRDLTLQGLAEASRVSRATLSRIETGEVSPTAETLGRLAAALSLPISQLLAPMEPGFAPLVRQAAQAVWRDPANGFTRRVLSPPGGPLRVELIECHLAPRQRIDYPNPPVPGQEHHLALLSGALSVALEGEPHELRPGDCLRYRLHGASAFATGAEAARYIVALA